MRNKKGFTLIELLVVIAIIALLMSILMPALAEVRKQARTMLCKTRLSNLCKMAYLYAADNDGLFWMGAGARLGREHLLDSHDMWPGACGKYATDGSDPKEYVEQRKIFLCPEATKPQMEPPWTTGTPGETHWPQNTTFTAWGSMELDHDQWAEPNFYSSYGDNASLTSLHPRADNWQWDGDPEVMRRQNWQTFDLEKASEIPMFMDAAWVGVGADNNNIPPSYEGEPISEDIEVVGQMYNVCLNRHKQAVNICYVDGHCETVALKQLWYQRWKRTSYMDGRDIPNWKEEAPWMEHFRRE